MIGILDSGLSALRLAAAIRRQLPAHDLLLYVDTARGPWGLRSSGAIREAAMAASHFLVGQGARLLLCASHGAAAEAAEAVQRHASVPLLDVITPAAEAAVARSRGRRIGVLGSPALVLSRGYEDAINRSDPNTRVFSSAAPLILPLTEHGWLKKPETRMILKKYLHSLKLRQVDTLICAGGHFALLEAVIQRKMGRRVAIVDPLAVLARRLVQYLTAHPELDLHLVKNRHLRCAVSDVGPGSAELAARYFGGPVTLRRAPSIGYSRAV